MSFNVLVWVAIIYLGLRLTSDVYHWFRTDESDNPMNRIGFG